MFERFSRDAREVVTRAQAEARRLRHDYIGTEHILLGLLDQPATLSARLLAEHGLTRAGSEAAILRLLGAALPRPDELDGDALEAIGIDLAAIREKVEAAFGPGALDRNPVRTRTGRLVSGRHLPFTNRAKKALELALREAVHLKHNYIGDGHILLGLLRGGDGLAVKVIADASIDFDALRAELHQRLPTQPAP
jgi:ATP-dependent Clp protease ATP-binding subunit ClpA